MLKLSLVLAPGFGAALLGAVLSPIFEPVDLLVTPGVTTATELKEQRAFRNVVHAAGDEFWQLSDKRLDLNRLQETVTALQHASAAPAKLHDVAILRFDGRTGLLKAVYLER
jgi:hypothetical protein